MEGAILVGSKLEKLQACRKLSVTMHYKLAVMSK